jgi:hypothetical protein
MFYNGYNLNKYVQDSIKVILLYYKQVDPKKNSTRKDVVKAYSSFMSNNGKRTWDFNQRPCIIFLLRNQIV